MSPLCATYPLWSVTYQKDITSESILLKYNTIQYSIGYLGSEQLISAANSTFSKPFSGITFVDVDAAVADSVRIRCTISVVAAPQRAPTTPATSTVLFPVFVDDISE